MLLRFSFGTSRKTDYPSEKEEQTNKELDRKPDNYREQQMKTHVLGVRVRESILYDIIKYYRELKRDINQHIPVQAPTAP